MRVLASVRQHDLREGRVQSRSRFVSIKCVERVAGVILGEGGRHNWPVVGWCVGKITKRNFDARVSKKIDGQVEKVNFFIYYEIDGDEVKTVLRNSDYGGEGEGAWVLLEAK